MEKKKLDVTDLYELCNTEQLFTCGSNEQYDKMFELAKNGVTRTELAYILYICSNYKLDEIDSIIAPLFKKCNTLGKKYCTNCKHYDYCDIADCYNGDCGNCNDYSCENNPKFKF